MSRILCVAVVLSASLLPSLLTGAGPAAAGMSEGVAAVTVGDYDKAIAEFQPLASAGDPAAQYHLAKIYLEGRSPADGVPQGIALMTKAANGGYPEAQAQLGLMYAMGLGVDVDNMQAYDWLTKAIAALPAGTRRTVAEANRDAVVKRMNAAQQNQVAAAGKAKPAEMPAAKPAATQEAAKKSAAETTTAKATTAKATAAATTATTAKATTTKTTTAPAATAPKTVTEAAATNKTKTTATTAGTTTATTAKATANTAKPTTGETKAPEKPAQVASAKTSADAPNPAAQKAVQSGVRIQLISMPSEDAAWAAWKQLSGKYSGQLSGLTPIVEPADLGDKGKFYRVQTGPFTTVAAAQERCTAMKEAGLDCLVVGKP